MGGDQSFKGWAVLFTFCFVDDLLLFAKADNNDCCLIRDVLEAFCSISGIRINFKKSKMFVSPNVSAYNARVLSQIVGIPLATNLDKYLGVPIIHKKRSREHFKDVLDKVTSRLAGWKTKFLSFMGRATLIQSVASSILNYTM